MAVAARRKPRAAGLYGRWILLVGGVSLAKLGTAQLTRAETAPGDGRAYDYSLQDINPKSPTSGDLVGPSAFVGQVTMHYFGHQR
eukprot:SAG31_NODE_14089_length_828_cov_0.843621_2_plen_85_part_00